MRSTQKSSPNSRYKERIFKAVMNDVPSVPIGDFENTLSFPGEETLLGRGGFPHIPMGDVPCPPRALLTVFSTTQLEHLITKCDLCHLRFGNANAIDLLFDSSG